MLSMDFKNIEVYKLYRLIPCLDFKKVSMNGANWIVQIVSIDVVFELQRIVQIVYWCCFVWISNRFQWIVRVVSIDVVFWLKLGWIVGSPNCAGKLYSLMSCLDFKRVSIRKSYYLITLSSFYELWSCTIYWPCVWISKRLNRENCIHCCCLCLIFEELWKLCANCIHWSCVWISKMLNWSNCIHWYCVWISKKEYLWQFQLWHDLQGCLVHSVHSKHLRPLCNHQIWQNRIRPLMRYLGCFGNFGKIYRCLFQRHDG